MFVQQQMAQCIRSRDSKKPTPKVKDFSTRAGYNAGDPTMSCARAKDGKKKKKIRDAAALMTCDMQRNCR